MYHYFEAITNTKGDALIGYYVRAVDPTTGSGVSLYADESLTPIISVSGLANASQVDSDGNASFWINGGEYHVDIYATDGTTFVRRVPSVPMSSAVDVRDDLASGALAAQPIATRTALAALVIPTTDSARFLSESGREGTFVWSSANNATNVTNDPQQGVYVAPASAPTGASGAWVRKYSGWISVKWFGAKGDSNATASTGTDDTVAIQAAINYVNTLGGGTLYFPEGYYKTTAYLTACANLTLVGAGKKASLIVTAMAGGGGANLQENTRNGSILYSNWPSNSSTNASIVLKSLALSCANAANVGAGFYDNGGTFITIDDCWIKGSKYGAIFDQSELADITGGSIIEPANNSGACVWIANGADLKAGNSGGFTNRIGVSRCQLNAGNTVNLIQDDGGAEHTFGPANNYNGGLRHLRMAGVNNFLILGSEYEAASDHNIEFTYLTAAGTGTGSSSGAILGGIISAPAGKSCVHITSGDGIFIGGGVFLSGGGGTNPIGGASNCAKLGVGDIVNSTAVALTDGWGTLTHRPLMIAASAPAADYYRQGAIVFNNAPTADSVAGWRCTVSGSPGTWETLYWWTDGDKGDVLVNADGTMVAQSASAGFAVSGGALTTSGGNPNFGLTGGYSATFDLGTTGILRAQDPVGDTCEYHVRPEATKKGQVSFTHNAVADRWSIGIKGSDANLYFAADRTLTSVKMTLTSSALNLATGVALQNNGTAIINGSGVLQAAGFPALTGDVTTAAGALATTIAAGVVTYAKIQNVSATSRILGRKTAAAGVTEECTLSDVLDFVGSAAQGDILYRGAATWTRLGAGTSGQFLKTLGAAANPAWADAVVSVTTANGVSATLASGSLTFTLGAITPSSVASTGAITSSGATSGIGYATGAGGAVTQGTSRTTGVTLNKAAGAITLFTTTTTAGLINTFTVTNSAVAATDTIVVTQKSGLVTGPYVVLVTAVAAGSFNLTIYTPNAVASDAPVFNFAVVKAVAA